MITIKKKHLIIGIDATNIRDGGGLSHLVEVLKVINVAQLDIDRIIVWGGMSTLSQIEERPWLIKSNFPALNKGFIQRTIWQCLHLSKAAQNENCDLLFVPGGSYVGSFKPVVVMSQNLLPFDMVELRRYGWSLFTLKLLFLRYFQSRSFRKADGIIFLTKYASKLTLKVTGKLRGKTIIIPHGFSPRFNKLPKIQRKITEYSDTNPYRILYLSRIEKYKHQLNVVVAVNSLRKQGLPISLDLAGSANAGALDSLNSILDSVDLKRCWVTYHGSIPYKKIHSLYKKADMAVWASTCETFGIILLEKMASALPIACSKKEPAPNIAGESALYFDAEKADDILRVLHKMIMSPILRKKLAKAGPLRAKKYSWLTCANSTFIFLKTIVKDFEGKKNV